MEFKYFFVTISIAVAGSVIGKKLKMPAGILLGALFFVAIYQLWTGKAVSPSWLKIISQGLVGTHIGSQISSSDIHRLKELWGKVLLLFLCLLIYNFITSLLLGRLCSLSAITTLCSFAPCSIADMSLLCNELGGEASVVAVIQSMRLFFILAVTPLVAARYGRKDKKYCKAESCAQNCKGSDVFLTLLIGLSASAAGFILKIPAGCLSCSMIVSGFVHIKTGAGSFPPVLRKVAQCICGMLVGSYFVKDHLLLIVRNLIPIASVLVGYVFLNMLLAKLFSRDGKMSFITSLFSAAPGGMSDMGLLAAEFGGDIFTVAFFQQMRYICVVLAYPWIARMLAAIL